MTSDELRATLRRLGHLTGWRITRVDRPAPADLRLEMEGATPPAGETPRITIHLGALLLEDYPVGRLPGPDTPVSLASARADAGPRTEDARRRHGPTTVGLALALSSPPDEVLLVARSLELEVE